MLEFYECYTCNKISPALGKDDGKCPLCGGTKGERRASEHVKEALGAGVLWNIDPTTGERVKK